MSAAEALRRQKVLQLEDKMRNRAVYRDGDDHIFKTATGEPLSPYTVTEQFRKLAKKAKVSATLHECRHTSASWLLAEGVDIKTASDILGHQNASITLTVYAHVTQDRHDAAVAAIDRRFGA